MKIDVNRESQGTKLGRSGDGGQERERISHVDLSSVRVPTG